MGRILGGQVQAAGLVAAKTRKAPLMPLFRLRPRAIEAMQWTGQNQGELAKWILAKCPDAKFSFLDGLTIVDWLGTIAPAVNYWIVFHPSRGFECLTDWCFQETYEEADRDATPEEEARFLRREAAGAIHYTGELTADVVKALEALVPGTTREVSELVRAAIERIERDTKEARERFQQSQAALHPYPRKPDTTGVGLPPHDAESHKELMTRAEENAKLYADMDYEDDHHASEQQEQAP